MCSSYSFYSAVVGQHLINSRVCLLFSKAAIVIGSMVIFLREYREMFVYQVGIVSYLLASLEFSKNHSLNEQFSPPFGSN